METPEPPRLDFGLLVSRVGRRLNVTLNLLFIVGLLVVLQVPLLLVNNLRQERIKYRGVPEIERLAAMEGVSAAEGYRMVERALKYSPLVLALVFTAFFLFETLTALRLHMVHYALVGAALCLFYLALLALGEVLPPGVAYAGAATASSLLVVLYCVSILKSAARAGLVAGLLAAEHGVLFVILRMEHYALLAGTAALFVALGAVMFFTRNVDWFAQGAGKEQRA
jgi:inner membrane protein involved in colicin E2 resistance